ncbi:hypothetical protein [Desulfoluna limicola]|nr:hypothetical protein [Desulfoluna limicola]
MHFNPPDKHRRQQAMESPPIGTLETPHTDLSSMPTQPKASTQ